MKAALYAWKFGEVFEEGMQMDILSLEEERKEGNFFLPVFT